MKVGGGRVLRIFDYLYTSSSGYKFKPLVNKKDLHAKGHSSISRIKIFVPENVVRFNSLGALFCDCSCIFISISAINVLGM